MRKWKLQVKGKATKIIYIDRKPGETIIASDSDKPIPKTGIIPS